MITRDEFYTTIKILLDDTFEFLESSEGQNWHEAGYPAFYFRHLKIDSRRGVGKTYAATKLAAVDYNPTLLVFQSCDLLARAVKYYDQFEFYQTNPDYAFTIDKVMHRAFLPTLGQFGQHHTRGKTPLRFKLGIIDDASLVADRMYYKKYDELLHIMFSCCDVVLELA